MPRTTVVLYCDEDGVPPLKHWLSNLPAKPRDKCLARIERLRDLGHEIRRPEADYLRDGIHELRVGHAGINYRILYFFHGRAAVILSHGVIKQRATVEAADIERAIRRKQNFQENPDQHTYRNQ